MPNSTEQDYSNHAKIDPPFHYFILPVFVVNFGFAVTREVRNHSWFNLWNIIVAAALVGTALLVRIYALKVQDRVIRLEERLRLGSVAEGLKEGQLVALRFASDAEAPALARQAAAEKLGAKQIKKAIQVWRPDHWRV